MTRISEGDTVGINGFPCSPSPAACSQSHFGCDDAGTRSGDQLCSSTKGFKRNTALSEVPCPHGIQTACSHLLTGHGSGEEDWGQCHTPQETSPCLPGNTATSPCLLKSCFGPKSAILQLFSSAHSRARHALKGTLRFFPCHCTSRTHFPPLKYLAAAAESSWSNAVHDCAGQSYGTAPLGWEHRMSTLHPPSSTAALWFGAERQREVRNARYNLSQGSKRGGGKKRMKSLTAEMDTRETCSMYSS